MDTVVIDGAIPKQFTELRNEWLIISYCCCPCALFGKTNLGHGIRVKTKAIRPHSK